MLNLLPTDDAELNADCIQARKSMETVYSLFFFQRCRKVFFKSLKMVMGLRYLQRWSERGPRAEARRDDHRCATEFTNTANSYFCCANQPKVPQIDTVSVCECWLLPLCQFYSHWREQARCSLTSAWGWPTRICRHYLTFCGTLQHVANTWFRWHRTVLWYILQDVIKRAQSSNCAPETYISLN